MTRIVKLIVFGGALFFLAPCAPTPTRIVLPATGTWRGSIVDGSLGTGTVEFVLPPPGSDQVYRGTWQSTWQSTGSTRSVGGSATAAATGDHLSFTLGCGTGGPLTMRVDIVGPRMTGSYGPTTCSSLTSGTVDLTLQ